MGKLKVRKIKKSHKICKTKWGGMEIKKNKQETSHDLYLTGRSCPRLNSPRLKGYSPGFTAGSCDAEIPEDWAVVDDSVLDVFMAERVKCGLGWVASNEERDKAQSCNCTYMSQQFKLALMIILCTFSHFSIMELSSPCLNGYTPLFTVGDSGTEGFGTAAGVWSGLDAAEVSELLLVTAVRGKWAWDTEPDCSWDSCVLDSFARDVPAQAKTEWNHHWKKKSDADHIIITV